VRAEAIQSGIRRTVTSHLWLEAPPPSANGGEEDGGCGCRVARPPLGAWALAALGLAMLARVWRRRR
jgi:MYXO-CTERM domain-containing protein